MKIVKKTAAVKSSKTRRPIRAEAEVDTEVEVAPEAAELILDTEDVADLIAEVTGEDVTVEVADDSMTFTVGEEEYVVEPDEDAEIELLETSRKSLAGKRTVAASRDRVNRRPAARKVTRR